MLFLNMLRYDWNSLFETINSLVCVAPLFVYPPGWWTERLCHPDPHSKKDLLPSCGDCAQTPAIRCHFRICLHFRSWGHALSGVAHVQWLRGGCIRPGLVSSLWNTLVGNAPSRPPWGVGQGFVRLTSPFNFSAQSCLTTIPFTDIDLYTSCTPNSTSASASGKLNLWHPITCPYNWLQLKSTKSRAISVQT